MKVISVNISEKKGTVKTPVEDVTIRKDYGIVGDAHAGKWHRQISLLAEESLQKMQKELPNLKAGDFAENVLTRGLILHTLPVGTLLQVGQTVLRVSQIGKECHKGCQIRQKTGHCIMPTEGIFATVIQEGQIFPGDPIHILQEVDSEGAHHDKKN
uniref:MOSC domain-containing protein n=1 Tax=Ndongobacter massiliensis TaxID=1871025 RepID=UPI000930C2BC|nr:MOSC domain-containing protein [Ndongobacter massiliensis]